MSKLFNLAKKHWDVVIVGSGLSGLTSAYRLLQAKSELSVLMVDALGYCGGRTRSINLSECDSEVSIGGTFTLFQHNHILGLAGEIGCVPTDGLDFFSINWKQCSPAIRDPLGLPIFIALLLEASKVVDLDKKLIKWDSKEAKELDKISIEQWINNHTRLGNPNFTRDYFYLLENFPDLSTVSALQAAVDVYIRLGGIPRNGLEIPPKVLRWEGGTGVFTKALQEKLSKFPNFCLRLNAEVGKISQPNFPGPNAQVSLRTEQGIVEVEGKYVVVATSPKASAPPACQENNKGGIEYVPPLSDDTLKLFSLIEPTPTVSHNILVVYNTPWWVNAKVGSFTLPPYYNHINEKEVWGNVVDGTMPGPDKAGILRIFCDSTRLVGLNPNEIKTSAIDFLRKLYPEHVDKVASHKEIKIFNWNDAKPTIPGVTYSFRPGVLSKYGKAFTTPHGCIHWAGSERSFWGVNWMEGAVSRGDDTAKEILDLMKGTPQMRPKVAVTKPTPVAASLLNLAHQLQPNPQKPMGLDELIEHHCKIDFAHGFTPSQCLIALKKLELELTGRRSARQSKKPNRYQPGTSSTGAKRPRSVNAEGKTKKGKTSKPGVDRKEE